jgi:formate-dependent nitrite reductase membrane component NrfD
LYTTVELASPMSWGSWILILVYPTLLATTLTRIPPAFQNRIKIFDKISAFINQHPTAVKNVGVLSMIVGAILGMYTGVLLSALGARPLWNSAVLWVLFLTSGLSAAAAFVHMITDDIYERELLAKADNGFLIFELFVFAQFLIGLLSSSQVHQNAARLLLNGPYAAVFWVFVIGLGIVIPLVIQLLAVNHKVKHTIVAPLMVIAGGLVLRFVIVYAGQYSHWTIAGR